MRTNSITVSSGLGIGNILAGMLSWQVNHDILWCIFHTICSWFYVLYYVIEY